MVYDGRRAPEPPMPAWRGAAPAQGMTAGPQGAGQPPSGPPPSGPHGGRRDHSRAIVLAVAGVCVLVLAASGVALRSIIAPPPSAAAAASPTPSASPSPTHSHTATRGAKVHALPHFPGSGSQVTGRITDRAAHISYAAFGSPWPGHATRAMARHFDQFTDGQVLKLGGGLYDTLLSGPLPDALTPYYTGASSLHRTAAKATDALFGHFVDAKRTDLASQPLHVPGASGGRHPGWLGAFKATYRKADHGVRWAITVVAVVDTGHRRPALLYGVVDNTHARERVDLNHWIASLRIA